MGKRKVGNETVVKGVRAVPEFFNMCDKVASIKGISRNELITSVLTNYCDYQLYLYNKLQKTIDKSN